MNSCPGIGPKCVSTTKRCAIPGRLPSNSEAAELRSDAILCVIAPRSIRPAAFWRMNSFALPHRFSSVTLGLPRKKRTLAFCVEFVLQPGETFDMAGDLGY